MTDQGSNRIRGKLGIEKQMDEEKIIGNERVHCTIRF